MHAIVVPVFRKVKVHVEKWNADCYIVQCNDIEYDDYILSPWIGSIMICRELVNLVYFTHMSILSKFLSFTLPRLSYLISILRRL